MAQRWGTVPNLPSMPDTRQDAMIAASTTQAVQDNSSKQAQHRLCRAQHRDQYAYSQCYKHFEFQHKPKEEPPGTARTPLLF